MPFKRLRAAFEEHGHPLGNDMWIYKDNEEWVVYIDNDESYRIKNNTNEIKIYSIEGGSRSQHLRGVVLSRLGM